MITVYLEDRGQDFLEWDIEDGIVVDCRPFQGWLWNGTKVHNTNIQPCDILEITPAKEVGTHTLSPVTPSTLNYPVERVIDKVNV